MHRSLFVSRAAIVLLASLLAACVSTPRASPDEDAAAKQFVAHPDAATIYVYRSPYNYYDFDSLLFMNGRLIGRTRPGTYFRIDTVPARNVLHGSGVDVGQITLDTRAGGIYFVALDVLAGHSRFQSVSDQVGQERVRACCALLENRAASPRLQIH